MGNYIRIGKEDSPDNTVESTKFFPITMTRSEAMAEAQAYKDGVVELYMAEHNGNSPIHRITDVPVWCEIAVVFDDPDLQNKIFEYDLDGE